MLTDDWFNYILVLLLLFTILFHKYAMRTGYLIIDLPIMLVVLTLTICVELITSILPTFLPIFKQQKLNGKIVLLTGAGSGIGRETSLELCRQGCILILFDMDEEGNEKTCRLIRENGGIAYPYTVDVSDRDALEEAAESVVTEHRHIDILVCNAGILHIQRLYNLQHYEIEQLLTVNFLSIVYLTKFFLNKMIEHGKESHIVCIASSYSLRGSTHATHYSASKGAISNYCISLMQELSRINCKYVHVSVVYPTFVNTPLISSLSKYFEYLKPIGADEVAKQIVKGIRKYKESIYIPYYLKILSFIVFLTPTTFANLLQRFMFKGKKFDPIQPNEMFD
ncbi:17-beta-hydroxysteroid dehydrogenase 13-like [Oopsacas minuta]|uniref:17-beta-hydroxysteroid dehydrogenase 13-like n=1 Tax=Oopsacas minuta TaxID=111878 RepID=A0AAV7KC16_9METZ|nr:17-beta-hydroxysteroid dehydrogenase 13-like [Oopsacas minuta]